MSNVKLAIRIRPFTDRELRADKDRTKVVDVRNNRTITITNVKVSASGAGDSRERVRTYRADYAFDSSCPVTNPEYASQDKVFSTLGRDVLSSLSSGCSACVLTYGQSATGKTHTMMGSDTQPGLATRLCTELAGQHLELTVSFLEIYNERVHDLLAGEAPFSCHSLPRRTGNARKDLRVREHPTRGPYVQNLRRVAVQDASTLLSLVSQGAKLRRTAATKRNSSSSRSHALLVLTTPRAVLYLADLAGSEKASWEGSSSGRLKESASINKSLVALSNVVSALVTGEGNKGRFVPYRDSALTWLLKDCFTGGSQMFIIATVSPSVSCYGESASTLRWAARARQLPTPINKTGPSNLPKAILQQQYDKLLEELSRHHIHYFPESGITYDDKHWALNKDIKIIPEPAQGQAESIGNIMNLFNSKAETSGSTPSSATSGSSEIINKMDSSKLSNAIKEEVDKLFGPTLERTSSGSNLKLIAPLRHKRRQYKSQEVLPIDLLVQSNMNTNAIKTDAERDESQEKIKQQVPILYDNQRAEIVASVTERLYSRLKKKEDAISTKVESTIDKKIMEPLSELKICTNARQRLVELSHKAMKNKRRIGIPAFTQTRKIVIRVKDQGVDAQTDLETYIAQGKQSYILHRDATTETIKITPRSKEIAVGPKFGSLQALDKAIETDIKRPTMKNTSIMTDMTEKCERYTQTQILPPPRKKRRPLYCSCSKIKRVSNSCSAERNVIPVVNINISQAYPDSSQSSDEITTETSNVSEDNKVLPTSNLVSTPDLLSDHNTLAKSSEGLSVEKVKEFLFGAHKEDEEIIEEKLNDEFPNSEDCELPRVKLSPLFCNPKDDFKNIILGRNEHLYPFNIVLSPPREKNTKKLVKFEDVKDDSEVSASSWKWENQDQIAEGSNNFEAGKSQPQNLEAQKYSDTSEESQIDRKETGAITKTFDKKYSVHKSKPRHLTPKSRMYREFLGLEQEIYKTNNCTQCLDDAKVNSSSSLEELTDHEYQFLQNRSFFESQIRQGNSKHSYDYMEKQLLGACDDLEKTVNKFEQSLPNTKVFDKSSYRGQEKRTPTEYLQQLVQLRREIILSETDSSVDTFRD